MFLELPLMSIYLSEIFIAFLITYFTTPALIRFFKKKGITGIDVHKIEKPIRAEMCGLSIIIGFTVALLSVSLLMPSNAKIGATILTVLLASLIGVYDDLRGVRQRHKVVLLLFAAVPLAWISQGRSTIYFPFVGNVNFGFLYPLVLVPIGVSAAGNLTNMLAGFNGLETGVGSIAFWTIAGSALILGKSESFMIAIPMVVALFAFIVYNWYPAEAFPGNAGTLALGSALASAVIVGGIEVIGICVLIPHIIDFLMKLLGTRGKCKPFEQREVFGDTSISQDGVLHPPSYVALPNFLMKVRPMTERRLVKTLMLCEVTFGIVAIMLSLWVI